MGIAHGVIEKFSTVLDVMAAKASRSSGTSVMAECVEVDENGVPWVRILGSESATPATTRLATAQKGDLVTMNIRAGKAVLNGNLTSPSCTQREYESLKQVTVTEIANIKEAMVDRAVVRELIAGSAVIRELYADVADIEEVIADVMTAEYADLHYAQIDFANVNSANIQTAKMRDLFAASGWFDQVTVTGDASITGQLKSVLVDGDTARFRNIYADALKILGEDGLYHVLNFMGLNEQKIVSYEEATPAGTENPSQEGWYVLVGGEYVLTEDTTVQSGTTYYIRSESYASNETQVLVDAYGEALNEGLHGSHIIAESITASQIDVSTLKAAMMLSQQVQVGATGGTHIVMQGDRLAFIDGSGNEVAYIAVDENGNSTFYMTRSVVVKDLRFGDWIWFARPNHNMALKWIGSTSAQSATS